MEQHDNLIRQNQISWSYNTDHMVPAARRRSCGCKPSVPCIPLLRSPSERLNKDKLSEGLVSGCMFCCISISLLLNDVFIIDHQWEVWGRGGGGGDSAALVCLFVLLHLQNKYWSWFVYSSFPPPTVMRWRPFNPDAPCVGLRCAVTWGEVHARTSSVNEPEIEAWISILTLIETFTVKFRI